MSLLIQPALKLVDYSFMTPKPPNNTLTVISEQKYHLRQGQFRLEASIRFGHPCVINNNNKRLKPSILSKCMLLAEKKCRKLKMGTIGFSEATEHPKLRIAFWETAIRRRKGLTVGASLWNRKKRAAQISELVDHLSLDTSILRLQAARKEYKKAKKNHKEHRIKFLEQLNPKDRARLKRKEAQRELAQASKRITGKSASKGVTKVEHNNRECTTREEIESTLLQVNKDKYHSSEITPYLQSPLIDEFGTKGGTVASSAVLNGTYLPPIGTDPDTSLLLQHLRRPDTSNQPPESLATPRTSITTDDHIKGWRKANERTWTV
ncbi:expressed unknown protein [Seminavis robusta]|uniref:Uncharacterized protein n=1 Tax=Seminavis robusta TaxID=568900 RepID=A0A9N8DIZ4_9STRA|nr:expressed unknown protein [Seminavis robusta]|eukprot:Sro113_g056080.1 n/a (321) ;mRNA; r:63746-64708